jgi:hypothetical protein
MSWIKNNRVALLTYTLLTILYYVLFCLFAYVISSWALKQGLIIKQWPFIDYQRHYYFSGYRNIWQNDPDCINIDPQLIYSPKVGKCRFKNPEFDTTTTFTALGRVNPDTSFDKTKPGIAVLGDSHAMGWGVNDADTFANALQKQTSRPVYNLAVSSYGTFREVKRLLQSGLINDVDTIIIQYCNNDKSENIELLKNPDIDAKLNAFKGKLNQSDNDFKLTTELLLEYIKAAVKKPFKKAFSYLHNRNNGKNFDPHLAAFKAVIKHYENDLKDKKVIVFYSNGYGARFFNFPSGQDDTFKNLYFYDLNLTPDLYFSVDDHLKPAGHLKVANELVRKIN